ncbi:MAG: glutathione S-transferase family protein [Marinicellaceae bacterium]
MKLYIANKNYSSWSLRPWVLMHELKLEFEEIKQPFTEGSNWQSFRKFSPNGMVPCLVENDCVIWDSLAITEYLAESYPNVWPELKQARTWARCASAEMHSGFMHLRNQCAMNCGLRIELNTIDEDLQKDINRIDELWNQGLQDFGGPFLAGSKFTAVDAFYAPVAFRVQSFGLKISQLAQDYMNRLLTLESMQSWYQQALEEPWREKNHELEALNSGKILKDYRNNAQ